MPIDDRIPDALEQAAGALPRAAGDWDTVRSRAVSRRKRRRGQSGIALIAAVALAAGIVFGTDDNDDHSIVTSPPEGAEVVAAIHKELVVLSADDGHVVRTLAEAPSGGYTIGTVTTSPDGSTVYYSVLDLCPGPIEIWSVPSGGGGEPQQVASGGLPLVSPDGRWLVYVERLTLDHPCLYDVDLVVRDLTTGVELRYPTAGPGFVEPVAWAPDSTHLVVRRMGGDVERPLDVTLEVLPSGVRELSSVENQLPMGYEFLPSGEPVTALPASGTSGVVLTFDPMTEDATRGRVVMEIDHPGFGELIDVDETGSKFLFLQLMSEVDDDRDLYSAEYGDPKAELLAEDVTDAVWLPSAPRPAGEIVAKVVENGVPKIVTLSALDGHIIREVSADPALANWGGISVAPDGDTAYITIGEPDPPTAMCGSDISMVPVVASIDLSDGAITPLIRASGTPIVSPGGERLAYYAGLGGCTVLPEDKNSTLGLLGVGSGTTARPYEGRDERVSVPIAWSPDGSELLVRGFIGGDLPGTGFFVLDQFPVDPDPTAIETPGRLVTGTFLPDGRLVVVYASEDPEKLMTDPRATYHVALVNGRGKVSEQLFEVTATLHIEQIAADSSGRLLLVTRSGSLATWTPGDDAPVKIIRGAGSLGLQPLEVQGAAWLPSSPATSAATTTTAPQAAIPPRPESIIAAHNAEIVELAGTDGAQRRVIVAPDSPPSSGVNDLSVSPDGTSAVLASGGAPRYCPGYEGQFNGLATIDLDTGVRADVPLDPDVQLALSSAYSPDGTQIAYLAFVCVNSHKDLVVRNLADGTQKRFTMPTGSNITVFPGWHADGAHLVVAVLNSTGREEWWVVDTRSDAAVLAPSSAPIPIGPNASIAPLGMSGRWAHTQSTFEDGKRVVTITELDIMTGSLGNVLLVWRDLPNDVGSIGVLDSDASGQHLLLSTHTSSGGTPDEVLALYRWSKGDPKPTKLANGIGDADW